MGRKIMQERAARYSVPASRLVRRAREAPAQRGCSTCSGCSGCSMRSAAHLFLPLPHRLHAAHDAHIKPARVQSEPSTRRRLEAGRSRNKPAASLSRRMHASDVAPHTGGKNGPKAPDQCTAGAVRRWLRSPEEQPPNGC